MDQIPSNRISIQVSLSGYFFKIGQGESMHKSGWLSSDKMFTTPEFQSKYDIVDIALLTPKCVLVPNNFYSEQTEREILSKTVKLGAGDIVASVPVPQFGATMVYSTSIGESLSNAIAATVLRMDGSKASVLPELYFILNDLDKCKDYNKILASYKDGYLYLAIAQGKSLLLCNCFKAVDFTTTEYFIFMSLKKLQLNPEVSTICFHTPLSMDEEMSLYRYFSSVEQQ
jgi:hypothetical protein